MAKRTRKLIGTCLVSIALAIGAATEISHAFSSKTSPTPVPVTADGKVTPSGAKSLLAQYKRAQASQIKALEQRSKSDLKELEASQKTRRKEWLEREKDARKKFLADKPKGPEVREYFRDYISRLKSLDEMLADDKKRLRQEQKVRVDSAKKENAAKLVEFQSYLKRGEAPPTELWP